MKLFQSARLKLTGWYLLIIALISLLFSTAIYRSQLIELTRFESLQRQRLEQRLKQDAALFPMHGSGIFMLDQELIDQTKERLLTTLAIFNGCLLVLAGGLGYFLAGQTLKPIEEMVEEQSRFVGDASHELRTPITSLLVNLEVFLRGKKPTLNEATSVIQTSVKEVRHLQYLSNSLLSLSQKEELTSFDRVNLRESISEAASKTLPHRKKKQVVLKITGKDIFVNGSKDELIELFTILIDNATKYNLLKGKIYITLSRVKNRALVSVKDTGIGIKALDLPHIFDRFYRADLSRSSTKVEGYGLGLSIAKKIVSLHKGSIEASSQPGKGSTFLVKLPLFS